MQTLAERIVAGAARGHDVTFIAGDVHVTVSWAEVHRDATMFAAALQARGVRPGDHVALLGPTTRALVTGIQAVWLAGATVVVLPLPMRLGSIDEFVAGTRGRIHNADVTLVLADADLAAFVTPEAGDPPIVTFEELQGIASDFVAPAPDLDAIAILQFTSGSTSDPKGVVLSHRAVGSNLDAIEVAAELDPDDDVLVSWLPLYHDMGLVGLLSLSMTTGSALVLGAPQDFLARPSRWLEWISSYGGTATAGPNFSYVLATRALRKAAKDGVDLDLSRMRVALNGAEPIDPEVVHAFCDAGRPFGLRPESAFPAFGMAEVAIAGTFSKPMQGMQLDRVDRLVLEKERFAAPAAADAPNARSFVKLGTPVPGLEIRIVEPGGHRTLVDREVGELEIRGSSVCGGYYRREELNGELFHDGWLRTGDLGYIVEGELVLCGRIKDVIIVGGRNVFPEDVERAVNQVEGIRAGNVIAFGVESDRGKEHLVVVAETKADDIEAVRSVVADAVRGAVGLPAKDIVLVAPGTLPKTSSGKLQRSLCRDQYRSRVLATV